ncbi:hypothetical protein [Pseudochelatococcus contaminans]|uniref:dTDP-4-amino-4,6-dideoxygalactose transaminase n=1 Tax=Pseudochelatococcus contaminans TaxID=1538103 RepID=A0A7W5Z507_9HYPH|nr:hypothetical protein [Pseudochelatococcus contaminans]MBB3810308.1 dTDP-4-amino-4,6-dideoxygalactose transaminase [Pseudochelatococcus contaminans]
MRTSAREFAASHEDAVLQLSYLQAKKEKYLKNLRAIDKTLEKIKIIEREVEFFKNNDNNKKNIIFFKILTRDAKNILSEMKQHILHLKEKKYIFEGVEYESIWAMQYHIRQELQVTEDRIPLMEKKRQCLGSA